MKASAKPEAAFQRQVLDLAKLYGWRRAHFRPARTVDGWRTPVEGDAKGFPDLILLRGSCIVVAELKRPGAKPSAEQTAWLEAFEAVGAVCFVWNANDWPEVVEVLRTS